MIPGEIIAIEGDMELNSGRAGSDLRVENRGDRPIQIGSHYHFFEANRALYFSRSAAYGMRLDIPAGTAARFEPGDTSVVRLVPLAGARRVFGLNGLVQGHLDAPGARQAALERVQTRGFGDIE